VIRSGTLMRSFRPAWNLGDRVSAEDQKQAGGREHEDPGCWLRHSGSWSEGYVAGEDEVAGALNAGSDIGLEEGSAGRAGAEAGGKVTLTRKEEGVVRSVGGDVGELT